MEVAQGVASYEAVVVALLRVARRRHHDLDVAENPVPEHEALHRNVLDAERLAAKRDHLFLIGRAAWHPIGESRKIVRVQRGVVRAEIRDEVARYAAV